MVEKDTESRAKKGLAGNIYPSKIVEIKDTEALYYFVETKAIEAIEWYLRNKRMKCRFSQWIRFGAILSLAVGGMFPIIAGLGAGIQYSQYGYVFIAFAAALIGLDKFFGFSTAWIRFMSTQIALQKLLAEMQMTWSAYGLTHKHAEPENPATAEDQKKIIQTLTQFRLDIVSMVEHEMKIWVEEFQSNLAVLDRKVHEAETQKKNRPTPPVTSQKRADE